MSPADLVKRALLGSLGFGATVATVHLAIGMALMLVLNVPPMTAFAAMSVPMEIGVALPVGLLFAPVLLAPRGQVIHTILLALTWLALERWVAVDPTKLQMWVAPTIVATLLFGAAAFAFRRFPLPVVGAYLVLPPILLSLPIVSYQINGYEEAPLAARPDAPANAPDVLFIVMDTTRAKSVSSLGYARDTTPNFDALAKEGALFTQANSPSTWSLPAHASLFTGTYPSYHEGHDETRFLPPYKSKKGEDGKEVQEPLPTIAQAMAQLGWETRAFSANPYISDTYGLTRGFDSTDKAWKSGEGGRQFSFIYRLVDKMGFAAEDKGGAQVVENISAWLEHRPKDARPAFVFVNFLEAHFPFNQLPEEFLYAYTDEDYSTLSDVSQTAFGVQFGRQLTDAERAQVQQPLLDMYDGGVKYTDKLVGDVIRLFRERGTLDDTIVIVVGDHGEMMGEHGAFGHVTSLYQPDLHVPLAIRYPARIEAGTRREDPISTVSLFSTIFDLANHLDRTEAGGALQPATPSLFEEGSRAPIIAERFEEKNIAAQFAHGTSNGKGPLLMPTGRYRTYREGDWKLAYWTGSEKPFLFDLASDPDEEHDLAASNPEKLAEMEKNLAIAAKAYLLPELDAAVGTTVEAPKESKEECEQLVALGYKQGPCE